MALSQALLDELWDFGDPAGSEARLRTAAEAETDAATRAELATQVARAMGLQERYADAEAVLSTTPITSAEAAVRVTLERGRLRNSAGDAGAAIGLFELAAEAAASAHLVVGRAGESVRRRRVVLDVGLGSRDVGDLLLGARRDRLVVLQLRNADLLRAWHMAG